MVNQQYVKLGIIGLCIAAISIGIGLGVTTRNKNSAAINVAKSTSTDSDLPWCPEDTRRELVVPGTESIYSETDNLRRGTVRKLGLTFQPDTPTQATRPPSPTYTPTYSDDVDILISTPFPSDPPVTNPTKAPLTAVPGIMKGTSSPSIAPSSAKPSAAAIVSIEYSSHYIIFCALARMHHGI